MISHINSDRVSERRPTDHTHAHCDEPRDEAQKHLPVLRGRPLQDRKESSNLHTRVHQRPRGTPQKHSVIPVDARFEAKRWLPQDTTKGTYRSTLGTVAAFEDDILPQVLQIPLAFDAGNQYLAHYQRCGVTLGVRFMSTSLWQQSATYL